MQTLHCQLGQKASVIINGQAKYVTHEHATQMVSSSFELDQAFMHFCLKLDLVSHQSVKRAKKENSRGGSSNSVLTQQHFCLDHSFVNRSIDYYYCQQLI